MLKLEISVYKAKVKKKHLSGPFYMQIKFKLSEKAAEVTTQHCLIRCVGISCHNWKNISTISEKG